ncbi:glycosyltransferase family 4 protein [Frankia sp. CNm7]|uniref:Glycosyltransferase family 4 protein n=1 Tax=Frankia nepalensis TaxID=1836974 RepID=A0A937UR26_9ACTN|nr:glycosyltransferase family 4 protein [Frankia nepalensis]MBL7499542.1 glycosyltransferase family 4 protein [Frankia nepalensis]MBL7515621.1 glycosyltransferase family 4 protein [Frankia nepalensis]MBL7524634.1 glycosyltransferase family 4 protein [Frankia nepalensis]MBL7630718.1 glycosyltransferase family 4 protein [Frankia nepalensis]
MTSRRSADIVTLCDGWDSSTGGIATFNRLLTIGLADAGYDVIGRVSSSGGATHPRVTISEAPQVPGIDDPRAWLLDPSGLPERVGVLVGHSRFSGGPAARLQATRYPDAQRVHFLHTAPEDLGREQDRPAKGDRNAAIERRLMADADLVVGVGPLLAEEARRLARQSAQHPPPVHELIPGMDAQPVPGYSADPARRVHLLLFGRADDPLKGATNAGKIVRVLAERGLDPQLTVRGAAPDKAHQQEMDLSKLAGRPVWVKPFTTDPRELTQDLWGTDLVLVASRHEAFGLVATEAASHGVPLLVGSHTGVGMFLTDPDRVPEPLGAPCVVPDTSANVTLWADRAQEVLTNLPAARARAAELREDLGSRFTWRAAGAQLMETLERISPSSGRHGPAATIAAARVAELQNRLRSAPRPEPAPAPRADPDLPGPGLEPDPSPGPDYLR